MAEVLDMSTNMDTTSALSAPPPITPAESTSAEETGAAVPVVEEAAPAVETPEAQFWAVVKEDPSNFDIWVKLLQIVEQQDKTFAAREAFDAFLAQFPYCYGYWKKYADYEQRQSGNETAKEVYRRGLSAVPLSIDLWLQYATFTDQTSKASDLEKIAEVQAVYEAAIAATGLDFRSDRLWEAYIDWQKSVNQLKEVVLIFDRVLAVPTQQYSKHFNGFRELVTSQRPVDILSDYEYSHLYHEVNATITQQEQETEAAAAAATTTTTTTSASTSTSQATSPAPSSTVTPSTTTASDESTVDPVTNGHEVAAADGDTTLPCADSPLMDSASPADPSPQEGACSPMAETEDLAELKMLAEQEALAKRDAKMVTGIRERAIAARSAVHSATEEQVRKRWNFEDGIKRPYFHVKPLERSQLRNWSDYLEFETKEGNPQRIELLYERCMVSCALYEDKWMKYIKYIELAKPECVRSIYERACRIHLKKKPNIHLAWAAYEEGRGQIASARQILQVLDISLPHIVLVKLHRISLERRHGFHDASVLLFEEALAQTKSSDAFNFYSWRFAQYLSKICGNLPRARTVMETSIEKDSGNKRLFQQLLSMEMGQGNHVDETRVDAVFTAAQNSTLLSQNAKQGFAQRRLQYLEEFGSQASVLMDAHESYQKLYKKSGGAARKRGHGQDGGSVSKMPRVEESADDGQQANAFARANQALQAMNTQPVVGAVTATATTGASAAPTYAYGQVAGAAQQPWVQMQYAAGGQATTPGYTYPATAAVAGQAWQYPQQYQ